MEKNEKKNGLLIFPNITTEQWGYCSVITILRIKRMRAENGKFYKNLTVQAVHT